MLKKHLSSYLQALDARAVLVLIAFSSAFLFRLLPVLKAGFPLNDGGMFYVMTEELMTNSFLLPKSSNYNLRSIPFAYPPLAFYIAGLINAVLNVKILLIFQFAPALFSMATVFVFWRLAKELLEDTNVALASLFCFALLPSSFIWQVMGGGLTRSIGMFFANMALLFLLYALRKFQVRYLVYAAIFAACAFTSHLATISYIFASALVFLFLQGLKRSNLFLLSLFFALAIIFSSPWWITVISLHGIQPFLDARSTVPSILNYPQSLLQIAANAALELQRPYYQDPFLIFEFVFAIGCLQVIVARKGVLLLWWIMVVLLDMRQGFQYGTVPLALISGCGVCSIFRIPISVMKIRPTVGSRIKYLILVIFFILSFERASLAVFQSKHGDLESISQPELDSIDWLKNEVPANSRVLVIENSAWWQGRYSEWIPALTSHQVVNTVQGSEWLGFNKHNFLDNASQALTYCRYEGLECLNRWMTITKFEFDYIYIPAAAVNESLTLIKDLTVSSQFKNKFREEGKGQVYQFIR